MPAATCSNKAICSVCGSEYGELDAENHDWDDGVVTTLPTCTKYGVLTHTCRYDASHTYTEPIKMKEHIERDDVKENVLNATCTSDGSYDLVTYCLECDGELARVKVIVRALGHEFGEWTVTTAPTESSEGIETRVCSRCGEKEMRSIPKLDHSHKMTHCEAVTPTETEEGRKEYYVCSVCGKWYEDAEGAKEIKDHGSVVIPALGKPDPIIYGFAVAPVTEWKKGSGKDIVLISTADFSKFVGVKVDGALLDNSNFTASGDDTKVTVKAEYLQTLTVGKHTIVVVSDDGEASATLNVTEESVLPPDTPDEPTKPSPAVWMIAAVAIVAIAAIVVVIVIKKKKK